MFASLNKYKDLALKVIYYTKRRQLGTKIFFATSKFQDVLLFFERNLKDSQTFLKSCYFLNGKQIFPNDILLYFCTVDPNLRLVEQDLYLEIEELEHIDDSSEPIYERLLKPLINPFKLVILNMKEGILQQVDFPKEKIKNNGFECLINDNYACCNSPEALYISYGKNFWIINNKNFFIEKKEMPISKEKHSMCYILSNNTVFIAGGNEDSFYYDIKTKEFITWGKMNGNCEKPALIQYGDFLYSFNSFNSSGIYFERTKLSSPSKKWEKLVPQSGDQESGFFYNALYGVSKCSGGNILFAGGINNQLRTFIYNLKLNVLYITPSKDESIILTERIYYKIDHNFNIAIPHNLEKDHIIAIVNKNSKSLNLLPFEQIGTKTRNNLLQYQNPRNRLPGNLVIQCRYMSIKDYENFLKQKEAQKKAKLNQAGKKEQKKLGDKLNNNNDSFKYQFRNKTPLALERISEGKSEEENDEDEFSRNKSSSAKKEKRKLDLGLKPENLGKYNFATQKRVKDEKKVKKDKNKNKNEKIDINNDKEIKKEEIKDKNNNNDIESEEIKEQKNSLNDIKQQINNNSDIKGTKTDLEQNQKKNQVKHKKINLNLDKKDEGINNSNNNIPGNKNIILKKNINIQNESDESTNKNIISSDKEKSIKININTKGNIRLKNNISKSTSQTTSNTGNNINNSDQKKIVNIPKATNIIKNNQQNPIQKSNTSYYTQSLSQKIAQQNNSNPFIDNSKYQNISEKESYHLKEENDININTNKTRTINPPQIKQNISLTQSENNTYKSATYKQSKTNRAETLGNLKSNINIDVINNNSGENSNKKKIGKNNSFKEYNYNSNTQDIKNNQKNKNVNINIRNNNIALTEGNKYSGKTFLSQSVNTNSSRGMKSGSGIIIKQNLTNIKGININIKEGNKDDKRYILTKNVPRVKNEGDAHKKNSNTNISEKK